MSDRKFETNKQLVWYFLKGSKRYFLGSILFACALNFMRMVEPKLIGYTVDSLIGDSPSSLNGTLKMVTECMGGELYLKDHLYLMAGLVAGTAALTALCRFLFQLSNAKGAQTLVKRMRDTLFQRILHLPFSWYSHNHTGDIIQRCTSDVEQIKMFLSEQLTQLFRIILLIILAYYSMSLINTRLTLAALIFLPITIGYSLFFHRRIGESFEKADIEEGKLSSIAQENLTGVRVVRAFGREAYESERFEKQNKFYTSLWVKLMRLLSIFWMSSDFISYTQILTVLCYGAYLAVNGFLSAGAYIEFLSYNAMLTWPVRALGRVISNLSKAGISLGRLRYIMNAEPELAEEGLRPAMNCDIEFEHVNFRYEKDLPLVLEDVSLKVEAGSTIGILGATGSGKSTLMYLLDRLYEPESGKITIGGVEVRDINRSYLRRHIGFVLQEPYLFSGTLRENIAIAGEDCTLADIEEAGRIASLEEAIERFTKGYETYVGERGVTLSGGQKQRAAIAQMLVRKPEIMIFDDSLSAVDAETDAAIRNRLKESTSNATVILISHRITTLMHASKIAVMDKGKIVQVGTHEELIVRPGIYKKIYELQIRQSAGGE